MGHLLQLVLLLCVVTGVTRVCLHCDTCLIKRVGGFQSAVYTGAVADPPSQYPKEVQGQSNLGDLSLEAIHEWETIASAPLTSDVIKFSNGSEMQLFPASEALHKHLNGTRRRLGDFRQCSPCTCCDRYRRWCLPTVCCYNIRCGLSGLPFGLCSFIPISCTCFGCRD